MGYKFQEKGNQMRKLTVILMAALLACVVSGNNLVASDETTEYSNTEIIKCAVQFSKLIVNFMAFDGENQDIMNCDQTMQKYW